MHQYDDSYLHNEALEINFWGLEISEDLLLIGHFIFVICFLMCVLLIGLRDVQEQLRTKLPIQAITRINLRWPDAFLSFLLFPYLFYIVFLVLAHRFSYVPPSRICLYPYINSRLLAPAYPP
ncbi:hypothetical protein T4A_12359 [Trichinella pseudospiralis]|uniref:Uncharacterized protein n=1 Tax=Trichinella pseudospiralis TaxID=6337 RepID=A0A0V1EPT8_TRIPS|nr:hypothetical protein T4A_12359 [Trichinella pseudospiralis]